MPTKMSTIRELDRANVQIDLIFTRMEEVDQSLLSQQVKVGTWSVIQILNHLYESEELLLKYLLYKKQEGATYRNESIKTKIKYFLLKFTYNFPIKLKAPEKLGAPKNSGSLEEIKERYVKLRIELKKFTEEQEDSFFTLATCKHPAVGRVTLQRMFSFSQTHTIHHEKQMLRRLIKLSNV